MFGVRVLYDGRSLFDKEENTSMLLTTGYKSLPNPLKMTVCQHSWTIFRGYNTVKALVASGWSEGPGVALYSGEVGKWIHMGG